MQMLRILKEPDIPHIFLVMIFAVKRELRKQVEELNEQVRKLTARVDVLEARSES